ncbi:hypothetical protein NFI96_013123 [Prochilodus magdalenae]|nr:hypothetical protein NFI96_013123 [Prochilodus magdalenae]
MMLLLFGPTLTARFPADKRLRDEGVSSCEEASHHLRETAAAIKELEASRKAAHEELEVETIETSKLRHQVLGLRHGIMNEILAAVAAARDANAAQLNQLQSEMKSAVEEIEFMGRRRKLLEEENAILLPEREQQKGSYAVLIDQLNEQLSEKASMQIAQNELMNDIRTTQERITQVESAKKQVSENMIQERKEFGEMKGMLQKEMTGTRNAIQEQREANAKIRGVLTAASAELMDKEERVKENSKYISQLERSIARLSASEQKHQQQLEDNIKKSEDLDRQREFHEKELQKTRDASEREIQALQEKTVQVDDQLEERRRVNGVLLQSIAELSVSFSAQRKKEDEALADHHSLSRRGVVPDCHGVTQNGSGSSSVTSPALVLVETPNESVCGGTVVSTKMNGLVSHVQKAWCPSTSTPTAPSAGTVLAESRKRLEERMASIAKSKLEVKEMKEEMKQLQETRRVNAELFQRNLRDLEGQLAEEEKRRAALEVERDQLSSVRAQHEQHMSDLRSDIALMKRRYSDLQEEVRTVQLKLNSPPQSGWVLQWFMYLQRERLQEHVAMGSLIDQLTNMVTSAEEERRQMKLSYRQRIQQLTMEAESITKARLDQEEALQVQESLLKEAESQFDSDNSRYETLKQQTAEMKAQKNRLELSIQEMTEQTAALLQTKEDSKRELQALRAQHMEKLVSQATEISTTEKSIYENGLMLERVSMENSRLHLRIEQMKEDICRAEREKEKLTEQLGWMQEEVRSLSSGLTEGWVSDKLATEFGDGPFLFQHNRTPVHRASSIKTWRSESGVEELAWPAQSPDLHPTEHLWDGLERRLRARPSRPTSASDLTDMCLEEWSEIPITTFLTLVESLPRRVGAVLAVKGGASYYTLWSKNERSLELLYESTERDRTLLDAMQSLIIKVQQRKHHIGDINSRLEKELNAMSSMLESTKHQQKQAVAAP